MRHELVRLEAPIDWEFCEAEWAGFFPSHPGRPATSPRLVAGLGVRPFSADCGSWPL
jgi:IS5 family transposase